MKGDPFRKIRAVVIVHESLPSVFGENMKDYLFLKSVSEVLYITHPLLYLKEYYKNSSRYEHYRRNKPTTKHTAFHWVLPEPLLYFKDIIYTIYWCFKFRSKWDVFLAADNLNALSGLILRKMGCVKKVVYHAVDYFPTRFENKLMNSIYHFIDKVCVRYADETWNISPVMVEAREKYNDMDRRIYSRQFTTPIGVWFDKANRKPFSKIDRKKIVFVGHLVPFMGVDLAIRAMPQILKKLPGVKFDVVGGGEALEDLRKLAKDLGVIESVKFYGWVRDRKAVNEILSTGALGLAPFNTDILDDKVKNADPAKIKEYMLFGMPVVVTKAISNYKQIEKAQCGLVINYDVGEVVNAVIKLLADEKLLRRYRKNALHYVRQFDYRKIFGVALRRALELDVDEQIPV